MPLPHYITEELQETTSISIAYLKNKQVAVIRVEDKEKYKTNLLFCSVVRGEDVFIPNGNFILQEDDYVYITVSAISSGRSLSVVSPIPQAL